MPESHPVPSLAWPESRYGRQAASLSIAIHIGAVALLFTLGGALTRTPARRNERLFLPADLAPYVRAKLVSPGKLGGGGGGGDRSPLPASFGRAPKAAPRQFTPPAAVPLNPEPMLTMEPTVILQAEARLPAENIAQFGDPFARPGPPSSGPGSGGGIGSGDRGGIGPGDGPGIGPGSGGGIGGERFGLGGADLPAALVYMVEPDYTDEARKAKLSGTVVIRVVVDESGTASQFRIVRPLGLGLDQQAVDAVRKWRFRPARRNGRPLASAALIEVTFRLL